MLIRRGAREVRASALTHTAIPCRKSRRRVIFEKGAQPKTAVAANQTFADLVLEAEVAANDVLLIGRAATRVVIAYAKTTSAA